MTRIDLAHPERSEIKFETLTFPDGEPHIKFDQTQILDGVYEVFTRLRNPSDLMILLMVADIIHHFGGRIRYTTIYYMMGARMDRRVTMHQPFTLKLIAKIMNPVEFGVIRIFHPHSNMTTALLDRAFDLDNSKFIDDVSMHMGEVWGAVVLCSPDKGAATMVEKIATRYFYPAVICDKERDPYTGHIKRITCPRRFVGQPVLVIDDLCDGGGTFIMLAEELKKKGAGDLYLAVSHGIFSKGIEGLLKHYKHIYTTNSFTDREDSEGLTVFSL